VRASRAVIAAQRHQLEVLQGTKKQRAADVEGAKATLRPQNSGSATPDRGTV